MWYGVVVVLVLLLDQITKILSAYYGTSLAEGQSLLKIIDGFLEITYAENRDGMMGIFDNLVSREFIFLISTSIILIGIFIYIGVSKNRGKWRNFTLTLILSPISTSLTLVIGDSFL